MRPPVWEIFLFILLSLVFQPKDVHAAGEAAGKLTVVRGSVTVKRPGNEKLLPARAGDTLFVGDILKTGTESAARAVLTDDSSVTLSSATAVRINQYAFEAATGRRTAAAKVLDGKARFVVALQNRESFFRVETAHALIAAWAADFVAVVFPEETDVVVLDRGVSVKNISQLIVNEVDLESNQKTVVKSRTQPSRPAVVTSEERRKLIRDAKHF